MGAHSFPTIAAVLALATVVGLLALRLRQPLIMAFIVVGIAVGPIGTGWVRADSAVELLARLGIAILLFAVGLRLDLHMIRSTGPVAAVTGLGQVVVTVGLGYGLALALGMDAVTAIYIAVALAFSSTIIIVKLLSDRRELDQLHGRIAVGFLIVQDILVVLVMIVLAAVGPGGTRHSAGVSVAIVLLKGAGLLGALGLLMRYVLPWLLPYVAQSQELLVLFGVSYAAAVAALSQWLGFSSEVGAFLAGVSLAGTRFRDALGARLSSLRDFLLLFFFLDLGARIEFVDLTSQITAAAVFVALVLVGKPLIVAAFMVVMRYPTRVSVLTALPTAQISEFSWILAALGVGLGHITNATVSLITVVGLITIAASTYMTTYSLHIYRWLRPALTVVDRNVHSRPQTPTSDNDFDVVLFGLGRFGSHLADQLGSDGHRVLAIDFDPHEVKTNTRSGVTAIFGSAEDTDLLDALPLDRIRYVISAVPTLHTNLALLHALRDCQFDGMIALTAHTRHDAQQLRAAGIHTVLEPFSTAAQKTSQSLHRFLQEGDQNQDNNEHP
ncbi:cation:proton antiporter family protein [Mycobacterium sp. D16R24]|uniref:cation:proton antiporter n=1 Tax=Mycobacterium sp. D16R24 TaxID=1855656 RepID=UPI000991AA24|nr:cation:proton antiporter family protein [Mycobacterium sp. D16R24]